jgi:outer membrane lipoprotein LolB
VRRLGLVLAGCAVLGACVTAHRPAAPAVGWGQRAADLQRLQDWQLDGRAAVAVGNQGWQATLHWTEHADAAELRLAGPFGVGAMVLKQTPEGVSLNGSTHADTLTQVQDTLGFELPIEHLRYWLLGVPDPAGAFDLTRNGQDRASTLTQDGWRIDYDRYMPVGGDALPSLLVLTRDAVRVRIAVDHWVHP